MYLLLIRGIRGYNGHANKIEILKGKITRVVVYIGCVVMQPATGTDNKTANINAKKHGLSHLLTTQLKHRNSKNKKMVITVFGQQSKFRRYAAKVLTVLSPFFSRPY